MQKIARTVKRIDCDSNINSANVPIPTRIYYPAALPQNPPVLISYLLTYLTTLSYLWTVLTPSLILLASFSRLLDLLVNEAIAGGDMRAGDILGDIDDIDVTGPLAADDDDDVDCAGN